MLQIQYSFPWCLNSSESELEGNSIFFAKHTLKTDVKNQHEKKHERQTQRPKAFDQTPQQSLLRLWKESAASRQIFKTHKPPSSDQNSSGTCHHSVDLWFCALAFYIQPYLEGCKCENQSEQAWIPFWKRKIQTASYIRTDRYKRDRRDAALQVSTSVLL